MKYAALLASLKTTGSDKWSWAMRVMAFVAAQQLWGVRHWLWRVKNHTPPPPPERQGPSDRVSPLQVDPATPPTSGLHENARPMGEHRQATVPTPAAPRLPGMSAGADAASPKGVSPFAKAVFKAKNHRAGTEAQASWWAQEHGPSHLPTRALPPKRADGELAHSALQRELSLSHEKMAAALMAQGEHGQALAHGQQSLAICIKLATSDPANRDWQHDLMVSLNKVAEIWAAQGEHHQALRHGLQSLALSEQLAASEPANSGLQRDWSVSMNKVASMWLAQGERAQALGLCQKSLALIEKLVARDPANAQWQTDRVVSLVRLAQLEDKPLPKMALLGSALAVLQALQAQGALSAAQAQWMALIESEMAGPPAS
jgi:hypothetical protein